MRKTGKYAFTVASAAVNFTGAHVISTKLQGGIDLPFSGRLTMNGNSKTKTKKEELHGNSIFTKL